VEQAIIPIFYQSEIDLDCFKFRWFISQRSFYAQSSHK